MMIILSKKEYDELIKKAHSLEFEVERRVDEEKKRIDIALHHAFDIEPHCVIGNPLLYISKKLQEILR